MYYVTTATLKIKALIKRIRAIQGGTSASKTVGTLQVLIDLAQSDEVPTLTSTVSESMPHLRKGAELDFLNILKKQGYYREELWNRTNHQYTFETGSIMEFFSADDAAKVHGPRRDRLFMNEVNHMSFETFEQLELRTNEFVFMDWNPTEDFWFYDEVLGKRDDVEHIILNYLDNEAIVPEVKRSLEMRKNRIAWFNVYGLGNRGEIEGRIYKGWKIIEEVPHEAKLVRYWVDFGYSNDPCSIGALFEYNGGYILHQLAYSLGMSNKMIADTIKAAEDSYGKAITIADSSEPKSIAELNSLNVVTIGAVKGPDSINYGIKTVQGERISITKESVETIKEYRKYMFETDNDGKITTIPVDKDNHSMDGIRYAINSLPKHQKKNVRRHEQGAFESSDPYGKPVQEINIENEKPMRKPDSWGPKSKYTQPGFDTSETFGGTLY